MRPTSSVSVSVVLPVKNEEKNLEKCLRALAPAAEVFVVDSQSTDGSLSIATAHGARVVQFHHREGCPKKRQWALESLPFSTEWIMLIDADEIVPDSLWAEIEGAIAGPRDVSGYFVKKQFHFLRSPLRFGGFSHSALVLFRRGHARFERLPIADSSGLDMEVHERLLVSGRTRHLGTPLVHEDRKGLSAYLERHNRYSSWEAAARLALRHASGDDVVRSRLFGDVQERRRWLKRLATVVPLEPTLWFLWHYVFCLGFLEGRRGLIAAQIRSAYIAQVRAKMFEATLGESRPSATPPANGASGGR